MQTILMAIFLGVMRAKGRLLAPVNDDDEEDGGDEEDGDEEAGDEDEEADLEDMEDCTERTKLITAVET